MADFPKIISVDDHVVEPAHLWADRLPAQMRERGPRVERARWGDFSLDVGATYKQEMTADGQWGDYWLYEDRLIYVHKRHVAIPLDATPDGDVGRFDRSKMFIAAMTYDEMRPGCYEPKARVDDLALAGVDGSIAFPTFPRFCGQSHGAYWRDGRAPWPGSTAGRSSLFSAVVGHRSRRCPRFVAGHPVPARSRRPCRRCGRERAAPRLESSTPLA